MSSRQAIRTPWQRKADILARIPDGQLTCRSMHRHKFPSDELTGKEATLPRGMAAILQRDGATQITDTCQRCGKVRVYTTTGALYDMDTTYAYYDPDDWVTIRADPDIEVTGRDFRAEKHVRTAPLLKRLATRPTATT